MLHTFLTLTPSSPYHSFTLSITASISLFSLSLSLSLSPSLSLSLLLPIGVCLAAGFCLFIVSRWQMQTSFVWLSSSQRAFYCLGSSAYPVSSSQALWWALLYVATGNNCHYQSVSGRRGGKAGESVSFFFFVLLTWTSSLVADLLNHRRGQCYLFLFIFTQSELYWPQRIRENPWSCLLLCIISNSTEKWDEMCKTIFFFFFWHV